MKGFESSEEDLAKSNLEETQSKFNVMTKSLSLQKLSTDEKSKDGVVEDVYSALNRASTEISNKLKALENKIKALPVDIISYLNKLSNCYNIKGQLNSSSSTLDKPSYMTTASQTTKQLKEKLMELKEDL